MGRGHYNIRHCDKNVHMDMCLILNDYRNESFELPDLTLLNFCWWGCLKSKGCKSKMDTLHEFLARISGTAARLKKREGQLKRTKHVVHSRVAKCVEVDSEIFEQLLRNVTNLPLLYLSCTNKIKISLTANNFFFCVTMLFFIQIDPSW